MLDIPSIRLDIEGISTSFRIVNAKKHPLDKKAIRALAEIETHAKVREWDVDIHTEDPNEMNVLFKEFFERLSDDKNQLFLCGKLDDEVVGFLGIHRKSKRMTHIGVVGVIVHPDYWRRGLGTKLLKAGIELARNEGFIRLEADTLAKNRAMIKLAEKSGFQLEGIRKMRFDMNGEYEDEALLALLLE
ncbi:GNAT family N-acetyltransferase [Candidatus Bathyarchaeota archaeon]|nr:GNAT family N-acetyltransferase [Candidatus Bathyarchaeota archaeon]